MGQACDSVLLGNCRYCSVLYRREYIKLPKCATEFLLECYLGLVRSVLFIGMRHD